MGARTAKEGEALRLFPVVAHVETERAGVRMGRLGMGWEPKSSADETYYEVARSAREAGRKFSERTKTGSNGHTGQVGSPQPKTPQASATLREFIDNVSRKSLGRYYRDFDSDEDVVAYLAEPAGE